MKWTNIIWIFGFLFLLTQCGSKEAKESKEYKPIPSDTTSKRTLTVFERYVLFDKGTERPFTGTYWDHFEKGHYVCKNCRAKLFDSSAKFESDCGWPSFDQAIKGSVKYTKDNSLNMERIEVSCANCGGHLGHVFDDGPQNTTGMRFCTNSVSIEFIPE